MAISAPLSLFKYFGRKDPEKPLGNGGLKVLAKRSLTGMMIEFAVSCPLFQGKSFFGVNYPPERTRPVYDPSKPTETLSQLEQIARCKSFDWKYESEYRFMVELKHTHTPDGSKLRLLPIDPSWITSVTFGLRCPESLRAEVARLLKESELKHIRPFKIRPHRETFDLERYAL